MTTFVAVLAENTGEFAGRFALSSLQSELRLETGCLDPACR